MTDHSSTAAADQAGTAAAEPGVTVSITDVIAELAGPYQPRDLVTANDTVVRVARFEGEFPWHTHDEDELFLCWDGSFRIELDGRPPVALRAGELFVVARGTRHRPVAEQPAHALMVERSETSQYGNEGHEGHEGHDGNGGGQPGNVAR
jgi:quercetin dioxygenase-like cupin family protein